MSIYKIPLPLNILEAAKERITWTLNTLPRICVSFSGGKDSGLMLHLTAEIARQMGKKSAFCLSTGKPSSHALLTMFSHYVSFTPMSSKSFTGLRSRLRRKIPFHNTNPNGSAGNLMSNGCVSPARCDNRS